MGNGTAQFAGRYNGATANEWQHIVGTVNGTALKAFRNGVLGGLPATFTGVRQTGGAMTLGMANVGTLRPLSGRIDEVRIYSRALELEEIQANYNSGVGSYTPYDTTGLVGWWHIDEKAEEVVATIVDVSGDGNTGTIAGAVFAAGHVPRTPGTAGYNPGTINWGSNSGVTLVYGEMASYESWVAVGNVTGGFDMPSAAMPATWFAAGENVENLPFYESFAEVAAQTGKPVQSYYFIAIIGVAFGAFLAIVLFSRSALLAYIAMVVVFAIGSSMTIVPGWIVFVLIVVGVGIMYLYKQVAY